MIVYDCDIVGVGAFPPEADPPLVVHSDAPGSGQSAFEPLQAVAGRNAKFFHRLGRMQQQELAQGYSLDIWRDAPDGFPADRRNGATRASPLMLPISVSPLNCVDDGRRRQSRSTGFRLRSSLGRPDAARRRRPPIAPAPSSRTAERAKCTTTTADPVSCMLRFWRRRTHPPG